MTPKVTILVIDDDRSTRETLEDIIEEMGYEALCAPDGKEGIKALKDKSVDYVLTDITLPGMDGLEILNYVRDNYPDIPVSLITGNETVETCQTAIRNGAWDYLVKPVELNELRTSITRALRMRSLYLERNKLREQLIEQDVSKKMIGESSKIKKVYDTIRNIAKTDVTVLLTGESGTGKELAANAIHQFSSRHNKPLIKVNLAALPRDMIESELFGHEKGAFTGAIKTKKGRFELADGGTLFLDEVAEMPLAVQIKLLRVLQEQEFERVGGEETLKTDIRLISATNQDLSEKIKQGDFREDLYFRINVVDIELPPLRERTEDIPGLCSIFINEFEQKYGRRIQLSNNVYNKLYAYEWPGNIRELRNLIERLCVTATQETVDVDDLSAEIRGTSGDKTDVSLRPGMSIEEMERQLIQSALREFDNNKSQAAKSLGIGLKTLYRKIEKFGLDA